MTRKQAWIDIGLMLGLTAAITVAATPLVVLFLPDYGLISVLIIQGLIVLLALRLLLFLRGQGWLDIGLSPVKLSDLGRAIYAFLACIVGNSVLISLVMIINGDLISEHFQKLLQVSETLADNVTIAGLAPMLLFVGVYEELAARGFLLNRFRTALVSSWAAILLSSVIFGMAHAYQGWFGVVQTTLIGMVLAYCTVRWGTLWPAILAHASLNLVSLSTIEIVGEKLS